MMLIKDVEMNEVHFLCFFSMESQVWFVNMSNDLGLTLVLCGPINRKASYHIVRMEDEDARIQGT